MGFEIEGFYCTFRTRGFHNLSKPNSLCFGKISKFPVFSLTGIFFGHFTCFPARLAPCYKVEVSYIDYFLTCRVLKSRVSTIPPPKPNPSGQAAQYLITTCSSGGVEGRGGGEGWLSGYAYRNGSQKVVSSNPMQA